ncbi:MAG TPA: hypothetical protein VIF11_12230 [Methylomirabilota bacterium]|jgi:hypothetical protein
MCDNEYLAHAMVQERLREAAARGAFGAMLRQASTARRPATSPAAGERSRRTRLELWWQVSAAWVAQLALPKTWNRL